MKYKYRCFKCHKDFTTSHDLEDTDKPTCNECFKKLLSLNTVNDYLTFIGRKNRD